MTVKIILMLKMYMNRNKKFKFVDHNQKRVGTRLRNLNKKKK